MSETLSNWFEDEARAARLRAVADSWLGTRYVQSGAVKGNGASCHRLAAAVLLEAGFPLPPVPERGMARRCDFLGLMRSWLDGHPDSFAPVPVERAEIGALLLCRIGIGHIALYLGGPARDALQVLRTAPAHYASLNDPQVLSRVLAAYQPLASAPEHQRPWDPST